MKYLRLSIFIFIPLLVSSCSRHKNPLPEEFFGLKLQNKLSGNEAKEFIDRLHLREVTPVKNEIGFYAGEAGNAIVYITYYNNSETAGVQEKKMIDVITQDNPVFFGSEFIKINDRDVYRCFGMGQSHFIFSGNNMLFWISVDSHIGRNFIEEYLNYVD
jgi:hypothetical protein